MVVKNALADISVFAYLAARFVLGALPMIWIYRDDLRKMTRDEAGPASRSDFFMFGGYAFQTAGIARTTPSKSAFITGLSVVLVPDFSGGVLAKENRRLGLGGAVASFIGLYYLTVPPEGTRGLESRRPAGDGLRGALCACKLFLLRAIPANIRWAR